MPLSFVVISHWFSILCIVLTEFFLQELERSLGKDLYVAETSPQASTVWSTRKTLISGWWAKERPRLVNTVMGKQYVATRVCQQCQGHPEVIRCCDCRPHPFLCGQCDVSVHQDRVFHNKEAMIHGFFQPLPLTTCVVERVLTQSGKL